MATSLRLKSYQSATFRLLVAAAVSFLTLGSAIAQTRPMAVDTFSGAFRISLISDNGNQLNDAVILGYATDAEIGFDSRYDARKLFGNSVDIWLTPLPNVNLTVNYVPMPSGLVYCPLNIRTNQTGLHTLRFSDHQNVADFGLEFLLLDSLNNVRYPLRSTTQLQFTAPGGVTNIVGRYYLIYGSQATSLTTAKASRLKLYPNPTSASAASWVVAGIAADQVAQASLVDALGRTIAPLAHEGNGSEQARLSLRQAVSPGTYQVKLSLTTGESRFSTVVLQ